MDAKHTPGPWFVLPLSTTMGAEAREPGSFSIGTSEDAGKANILCSRFPWLECADEMRANARLIAAAPELLKALRAIDDAFVDDSHVDADTPTGRAIIAARAAVSKAEGFAKPRFENVFCSQCGGEFGPGNSGYSHCEDHRKATGA
jgi:hypothetical protein